MFNHWIASVKFFGFKIDNTGPKISSLNTVISGLTLSNKVGPIKYPSLSISFLPSFIRDAPFFSTFSIIAYVSGRVDFSDYLNIIYLPGAGELTIFTAACVGACLGYLWFNSAPAEIFMGDVGALALGAALGVMAIVSRHEIVLFIMGGVFVVETASVILQVASFKLTGKRIFRMAPLHHHFELKGWPEPRVIVRFWIITVMLVLFGLATLKLR